jgi:hypothetical protein
VKTFEAMTEQELDDLVDQRLALKSAARPSFTLTEAGELWLALAPAWTVPLAQEAGLPAGEAWLSESYLTEGFESLVREGKLTVTRPEVEPGDEPRPAVYAMTSAARDLVVDPRLGDPTGKGAQQLRGTAFDAGKAILGAGNKTELLPSISRWAQLAVHVNDPRKLALEFGEKVDRCFEANNAADVMNLIAALRPLAEMLFQDGERGPLLALERARRRLELLYRREHDYEQLRVYLDRPEASTAVQVLMDDRRPDDAWALHFLGGGGVGKTMLVRHIQLELAKQWGAATARIDFDYLPPDYPRLDPGLLLLAFAEELRSDTAARRAAPVFDRAAQAFSAVHAGLVRGQRRAGRATDEPDFRSALGIYIEALRALNRPVLLLLDTCEELSHISIDGKIPENVSETFRILRALREGPQALDLPDDAPSAPQLALPDLRIIFAGRRPLASRGYGWSTDFTTLPPRPYLRLFELRGFTMDEGRRFVEQKLRVSNEYIPHILRLSSPDSGCSCNIRWDNPADQPPAVDRYNPYDLRMYADWANETPPPPVEDLARATPTQFIEFRILQRLHYQPLANVLPTLALMGHLDRAALEAVSAAPPEVVDRMWQELARQEWIGQRTKIGRADSPDGGVVMDLQTGLRKRLLDYYRPTGLLGPARQQAADYLEKLTLQADLAGLDWSAFDAAAQVLEPEPVRAEAWWKMVEQRLLSEPSFDRAFAITSALVGGEDSDCSGRLVPGDQDSPFRLAIRATYASVAMQRPDRRSEGASVWTQLAASADKRGNLPLRLAALAGAIVAAGSASDEGAAAFWRALSSYPVKLDLRLAASAVAAADVLMEQQETSPRATAAAQLQVDQELGPVLLVRRLASLVEDGSHSNEHKQRAAHVRSYAHMLAARALLDAGRTNDATEAVEAALDQLGDPDAVQLPPRFAWAGWAAPENLPARVRLACLQVAYPQLGSASRLLDRLRGLKLKPSTVDEDRLLSAWLQLRLATGSVSVDDLLAIGWSPVWAASPDTPPAGRPGPATCQAHRQTQPLFVTLALAAGFAGRIDAALLALRSTVAQVSLFDSLVIMKAERALLALVRRYRLRDEGEARTTSLGGPSAGLADHTLVRSIDALYGAPTWPWHELPEDPSWPNPWELHAVWATANGVDEAGRKAALVWGQENLARGVSEMPLASRSGAAVAAHLELDRLEWRMLSGADAQPASTIPALRDADLAPPDRLALLLRRLALDVEHPRTTDLWEAGRGVGWRRAAEVALKEGELLGLRLPALALAPLKRALDWFEESKDNVGAMHAGVALVMAAARAYSLGLPKAEVASVVSDAMARVAGATRQLSESSRQAEGRAATARTAWASTVGVPDWSQDTSPWQSIAEGVATDSHGWRPWAARALLGRVLDGALKGQPVADEDQQALTAIQGLYGLVEYQPEASPAVKSLAPQKPAPEVVRLPFEIDGALGAIRLAAKEGGQEAPVLTATTEEHEQQTQRDFKLWPYILAGALILIGGLMGLFFLVRAAASRLVDTKSMGIGAQIGWFFALLVGAIILIFVLIRSVFWLRARLVQLSEPVLVVGVDQETRMQKAISDAPTFDLAVNYWRVNLAPLGLGSRMSSVRGSFRVTPGKDYTNLAADFSAQLGHPLRRLAGRLRPGQALDLRIQVMGVDDGAPWEAVVTPADLEAGGRMLPFRFRRFIPAMRSQMARTASGRTLTVVTVDAGARRVAEKGWTAASPAWSVEAVELPAVKAAEIGVLHLFGEAEETTAGLRWSMGEPVLPKTAQTAPPVARLLRAEDLARDFPSMSLCVLQGLPADLPPERIDDDRRRAALARRFAAELFDEGVPAVLVLPPLPATLATEILSTIASLLADPLAPAPGRRPDRPRTPGAQLAAVIRELQLHILTSDAGETAVRWEVAFDVCLYCQDYWHVERKAPEIGGPAPLLSS